MRLQIDEDRALITFRRSCSLQWPIMGEDTYVNTLDESLLVSSLQGHIIGREHTTSPLELQSTPPNTLHWLPCCNLIHIKFQTMGGGDQASSPFPVIPHAQLPTVQKIGDLEPSNSFNRAHLPTLSITMSSTNVEDSLKTIIPLLSNGP